MKVASQSWKRLLEKWRYCTMCIDQFWTLRNTSWQCSSDSTGSSCACACVRACGLREWGHPLTTWCLCALHLNGRDKGVSIDNETFFSCSCHCVCVYVCVCMWSRERERLSIYRHPDHSQLSCQWKLHRSHSITVLSANHYATNLQCLLLLLSSTRPLSLFLHNKLCWWVFFLQPTGEESGN